MVGKPGTHEEGGEDSARVCGSEVRCGRHCECMCVNAVVCERTHVCERVCECVWACKSTLRGREVLIADLLPLLAGTVNTSEVYNATKDTGGLFELDTAQ